MSMAMYANEDAVVQKASSVVRLSGPNGCHLASTDLEVNCENLLGTRRQDVAPGASDGICPLTTGSQILVDAEIEAGKDVWLTCDGSGRGTPTCPAYPLKLGVCYNCFEADGAWYAELIMPALWGALLALLAEAPEIAAIIETWQSSSFQKFLVKLPVILMRADDGT